MSENQTPTRETARRIFATEFNDAVYKEEPGDGERATQYMLLPTGELANRIFAVGTLVEVIDDQDNDLYIRGEMVDATGEFFIDAAQFQQDAIENIRKLDTPTYVAITGKTRINDNDSGLSTKIRVESITDVSGAIYDRWVAETAKKTAERIKGFDESNETAQKANEVYDDLDLEAYRDEAIEALEDVQEMIKKEQEDE